MLPTVSLHVAETTRRTLIGARGTDPVRPERSTRRARRTAATLPRVATSTHRLPVPARRGA